MLDERPGAATEIQAAPVVPVHGHADSSGACDVVRRAGDEKRARRLEAQRVEREPIGLWARLVRGRLLGSGDDVKRDINLGRSRRLTLSVEVFNLTNATNKGMDGDGESVYGRPTTTVNPVTGLFFTNSTAGLPTTSPSADRFGGPRQVQLGARFTF